MSRGFTLIEVIVSLLIISSVAVGTAFTITLSLNSAARIRNDLIAANLAQEGIEVVRGIRDRDWHLGNSFGASLPNGIYNVVWNAQSLSAFSDVFLKKNPLGLYDYSSGTETIFKRKVIIEDSAENPPTTEKVVKVEITWQEKGGVPKLIQVESRLFNW